MRESSSIINRSSIIIPEHYSNYNQYYGDTINANPVNTNKSVQSFHKCEPYCTERINRSGSKWAISSRYFEENHWIPTLELAKFLIPLPDQVIVFAVATARKSCHSVTGANRSPINVALIYHLMV